MIERIIHMLQKGFNKIRPGLLLVMILLSLYSAFVLRQVYISKPSEPLQKMAQVDLSQVKEDPVKGDKKDNLIKVSITGQVNSPGVYELVTGAILQDLLNKAGGLTKNADKLYVSQQLNLAQELASGEQVYVPNISEQKLLSASSTAKSATGSDTATLINLNTASATELETLPGVGPATAEKIINARPFAKIEDIQNVSGIGEATFNKFKDLIQV